MTAKHHMTHIIETVTASVPGSPAFFVNILSPPDVAHAADRITAMAAR
ncbi:MAG: hypothetical protein ACK5KM_10640 [Hyphomicrobiaceae bacterium]